MIINSWENCYPSRWQGVVVENALKHPAKFSKKLIRRIYEHCVEMDWAKAGDHVVDPFGGVALGALDAMRLGLYWRGCELEASFAQIGNENIDLWNKRYSMMPGWNADALLLNGDSRDLDKVLGGSFGAETGFCLAVSSPPFLASSGGTTIKNPNGGMSIVFKKWYGAYGATDGQITSGSDFDFWSASRLIVEQTYAVLRPGGHACWVVKDNVKQGKLVDFTGQWRELCETAGFISLHEHHAEQISHRCSSYTLEGDTVDHIKDYKTFFRLISEKNGSPHIDWEAVLCMQKPTEEKK